MNVIDYSIYPPVIGERPCSWCGEPILVVRRPGRPRLYCRQACRQRAFEHRHGFVHTRTVIPLPGQAPGDRWTGTGYEEGRCSDLRGQSHALRTSVRPEGRRRETVCGALAFPVPGRHYAPSHENACRKCEQIVTDHPLTYGISPSNELSRLRSLLTEEVEERLEPQSLLDWLRTRLAS